MPPGGLRAAAHAHSRQGAKETAGQGYFSVMSKFERSETASGKENMVL